MIAPNTWKIIYIAASLPFILPLSNTPNVIAGLIWHPEIPPIVYAIATTDKPKAKAVPITVSGSALLQPKLTAVPHPIRTSTIVPNISAKYFFIVIKIKFLIDS